MPRLLHLRLYIQRGALRRTVLTQQPISVCAFVFVYTEHRLRTKVCDLINCAHTVPSESLTDGVICQIALTNNLTYIATFALLQKPLKVISRSSFKVRGAR